MALTPITPLLTLVREHALDCLDARLDLHGRIRELRGWRELLVIAKQGARILQDVTVVGPPRGAAPVNQIDLGGTLDYQVCSDSVCYAPSSLKVEWTIKLLPLDRERAPEGLRKRPAP